jgi:UDP-glucose 4-epimerase
MKSILITGGSGFIGQNLIKSINKLNFEVFSIKGKQYTDLTEEKEVHKLPKFDIIIHLAAFNYIPSSFDTPINCYKNNINSTLNILEKTKNDKSSLIFFSSYIYGRPKYLPIDEKHPRDALNPYTQSKIICEDLCFSYHRDYNVPITIFRPFNIYGPFQKPIFLIPKILNSLENHEIDLGNSKSKRDFVYISDVIEAIKLSLNINNLGLKIYNLGAGKSISVKDVSETILSASNSSATVNFSNNFRKGDVDNTIADITKIKNELGWEPKVSFLEGIKKCLVAQKLENHEG